MRLREWKIMNASQSTTKTAAASSTSNNSDYKNRFKKLLDYVKAHSKAERKEIKKLNNNGFHYSEHHNEQGQEWDTDILVATREFTDDWAFQYHLDGEYNSGGRGKGYEELIRALSFYINTPSVGTAEYDNLLTEWVVMKNNSSVKVPSSKDALWKTFIDAVIDYIDSIPELSSIKTSHYGEGSTGVWKALHLYDNLPEGHDIRIRFNIETENFEITTKYKDFKTIRGHGFNFLMSTLNDNAFTIFELGSFDFLSLRENFSVADDFKNYENLWN